MKWIVTFAFSVTEMDLPIVFVILFYIVFIEAKDFLQTGHADAIRIPDNYPEKDSSQVLALVIIEHNGNSETDEEAHPYSKPRLTKKPKTLPLISSAKPHRFDTDSSGDSNSDEYQDSDTDTDTSSEFNYYHEHDYKKDINALDHSDLIQHKSDLLRNRWKSCHKTAAKVCREACTAAYENACDIQSCGRKLKKTMKKECKSMCKEFFIQS